MGENIHQGLRVAAEDTNSCGIQEIFTANFCNNIAVNIFSKFLMGEILFCGYSFWRIKI